MSAAGAADAAGVARVGRICTFYSYKGGVGRSMALANVAVLLAQRRHRVLVVDWDLEAPGIERYFEDAVPGWSDQARAARGIVDIAAAVAGGADGAWDDGLIGLPLRQGGTIDLLSAGRRDDQYVSRLQKLDWDGLFTEHDFGRRLEDIRDEWRKAYDYVLIDSRTGVTDIGGICTIYLPDVLVALFTANGQSVDGVAEVISRVRNARSGLPVDRSALLCVPVPARDESRNEYQQSLEWRAIYHERFAELYADFLPRDVPPSAALDLLRIPNVPFWSFGERLPVLTESPNDPSGISYYYAILARLIETDLSWQDSTPAAAAQQGERVEAGPQASGQNWQGLTVWGNVPARNRAFIGQAETLATVRATLQTAGKVVLHGLGGVGKTQIATEYAHRFADDYDVVWWVPADDSALIAESFAALAEELGCAVPGAPLALTRRAVLSQLRSGDRWLLVFDGAEEPAEIVDWLPSGRGHVLITSRASGWEEIADAVQVDVFARTDSMALLGQRVPELAYEDANRIASQLGDLPLAVAQAAAVISAGVPPEEFLALLHARPAEVLAEGRPASYPQPLGRTVQLSLDSLRDQDQAAAQLAEICAFFAPEPVPLLWFTQAAVWLPAPFGTQAAAPIGWTSSAARLGDSGLARLDGDGLVMHRLVQAIIRELVPTADAAGIQQSAGILLAVAAPGDPDSPATWASWGRVLPHLLALDPSWLAPNVAVRAARFLIRRGDADSGRRLAATLRDLWSARSGPDDHYVLSAAMTLASGLRAMDRYDEARLLDEDTLERCRRLYGADHEDTLAAANNLAEDLRALGHLHDARDLDEDTVRRFRQMLGEDHPSALNSAANLAVDLVELGEYSTAQDLLEDVLPRFHRVLGEDHPDTLNCASTLAFTRRELGDLDVARAIDEDTLSRRRRVLGDDHPETLASANNLAADLRALGDLAAAESLDRDTLTRLRRVLGEDHAQTRRSARNLATDLQLRSGA